MKNETDYISWHDRMEGFHFMMQQFLTDYRLWLFLLLLFCLLPTK